jgi:hypothetical protein
MEVSFNEKPGSGVAAKEKPAARAGCRRKVTNSLRTLVPKEFDSTTKVELYLSNLKEEMGLTKSTKLFYK